MLSQRVLVALLLLPIGIAAILAGGLWFAAMVALILALAVLEFAGLFRVAGMQPSTGIMLSGVLVFAAIRYQFAFDHDAWLLPLFLLLAMAVHLYDYETGRDEAGTDFLVTVTGLFYIGLLGSFMLMLRQWAHGEWWLLLALPAVWIADSAAFTFGSRFGRNKIAPRLSPKKSWEGYLSGILFATGGLPLLLQLYLRLGLPDDPAFNVINVAILGFVMGLLPTLGDLGISMLKRQMGVKDTGTLLPGHGGMLDRIDSWLWAMPIAYFLITLAFYA
jgi:phosphatidate cytidylyltransferase